MMKKFTLLLATLPIFLAGCIRNNGLCYQHNDENHDGICDVCGAEVPIDHEHMDLSGDGKCDVCGMTMPLPDPGPVKPCDTHIDHDLDGKCDVCGADISAPAHTHVDGDGDHRCDICGAKMEECTNHIDQNHDGKCDYCGTQMALPDKDVIVYLVLSSIGLYNGAAGQSYADMFVENAIKYEAKAGSPLPGKDVVTSAYGSSTFECWYAYEGAGAPTVYATVPYENNKILYANFVANGSDPVHPDPGPNPGPDSDTTFTLNTKFDGGNWSGDNAQILMYCWTSDGRQALYTMNRVSEDRYTVLAPDNYYSGCLFIRLSPDESFNISNPNWDDIWNQSEDLAFVSGKHTAQITGWHTGVEGKSGVYWVA